MQFVHRCYFCGWQRGASSPTILEPTCGDCGSLLSSKRADEVAAVRPIEPNFLPSFRLPSGLALGLRLAAFGTVLFTGTVTGLQAGGPWLALAALGAAGLVATAALVRG